MQESSLRPGQGPRRCCSVQSAPGPHPLDSRCPSDLCLGIRESQFPASAIVSSSAPGDLFPLLLALAWLQLLRRGVTSGMCNITGLPSLPFPLRRLGPPLQCIGHTDFCSRKYSQCLSIPNLIGRTLQVRRVTVFLKGFG